MTVISQRFDMTTLKRKIVIVGGVAGGASAAAKARRVNEQAEIVMFEKGSYISFANCGLPYYIGGKIESRTSLFLQTPESFWNRFRVKVHVLHEVVRIDRENKWVEVRNLRTYESLFETYDKLILAPGAGAIVPPLPGITSSNIFTVKTVPDSDAVKEFIEKHNPRRAVVIGAGFIGLESAEVLKQRGLDVTVVEMLPQVLPPFDADVALFVSRYLEDQGLRLILSDGLKAFHGTPMATEIELQSGRRLPLDLAILSIGVRPEIKLAKEAGLAIGQAGGIVVDEHQQTSDPNIYAAGDAVEVVQLVTMKKTRIPLAGPANKQGRVAGANAAGEPLTFPGALGTAIVECMGITAAKTGLCECEAQKAGFSTNVSVTHSLDHAGYYPGGEILHIKLMADQTTGRLLGAEIVGEKGVDKRIDVLATALSAGLKVTDLENLDLAYAPQFSSAKDPVIMAGFVASNIVRDDVQMITCETLQKRLEQNEELQIVDVRTNAEFQSGHLPQARLIPIDELREHLAELDSNKETVVYCRVGLRAYLATRILKQNGFKKVLNLTGGILMCPEGRDQQSHAVTLNGRVSIGDFRQALETTPALALDVRERDEYQYEHIERTMNAPLSRLPKIIGTLPRDKELFVLCQTGVRTAQALNLMHAAGFQRIHAVDGGLQAWKSAGFQVERQKGPLPIMRQVQIVAGSLAFIGGLIPPLRWFAIIVGAGLVFAGVSGTCGMAILLSKLPWNKSNPGEPKSGEKDTCGPCGSS
jgi:NADPH-dependent 2,4-dienoyl-CoA reductase/sulfur reductase-like enzyme/rhodanese-related sulfurtransferase